MNKASYFKPEIIITQLNIFPLLSVSLLTGTDFSFLDVSGDDYENVCHSRRRQIVQDDEDEEDVILIIDNAN